jgi:hypothetical protein
MSLELILATIRIVVYIGLALYFLSFNRWAAWATLTLLVIATYAYSFTAVTPIELELIRTVFGAVLIYTLIRRA